MAILAFASRPSEFDLLGTSATVEISALSASLAPHCGEGTRVAGSTNDPTMVGISFPLRTEFWASCYIQCEDFFSDYVFISFYQDGTRVFHLSEDDGLYDEVSNTELSAFSAGLANETLYRYDMHFVLDGAAGSIDIYRDGVLFANFSGDTLPSGVTGINAFWFGNPALSSGDEVFVSAAFVSDSDTRGIDYVQLDLVAESVAETFTGVLADVTDYELTADNSAIDASGPARATYTKTALPAEFNTGYNVAGLGVTLRGRNAPGSTVEAGVLVISDSTEGLGTPVEPFPTQPGARRWVFEDDPDTASAWTVSGLNAATVGVKVTNV